jgi:hypothetical protein
MWHVWGMRKLHMVFWSEKLKERSHLEDPRLRWEKEIKMDVKK